MKSPAASRFRSFNWLILLTATILPASVSVRAGVIHGTVTEKISGEPVSDLRIRVYDSDWQIKISASTWTNGDGTYESGELAAGKYYVRAVSVYPQSWVTQYWYAASERSTAVPVQVMADEPVLGIDFSLEKGGYLSGTIRDSGGYPLVDLDLDLYSGDWTYDSRYSVMTGESGDYTLGPIPVGQWFLRADPEAYHGVCQQYWPGAWYREQAQILVVTAGQEIPGVDFALNPGGSIYGTVHEIHSQAFKPGCEIKAYSLDWIEQPIHTALSGDDGDYVAYGLPQGSYYLFVDPPRGCGAAAMYHPFSLDQAGAQTLAVEAGQSLTGIDFYLPEGNFELNGDLDMPTRFVDPGEMFGLTYTVTHKGTPLAGLPLFVILDIQGQFYFWPSWTLWAPPVHTTIDYRMIDFDVGDTAVEVFPQIVWPETGIEMDGLRFIAAVTNWSLTGLASDLETIEWSFQ